VSKYLHYPEHHMMLEILHNAVMRGFGTNMHNKTKKTSES